MTAAWTARARRSGRPHGRARAGAAPPDGRAQHLRLLRALDDAYRAWGHPAQLDVSVRTLRALSVTLPPPLNVTLSAACEMLREWADGASLEQPPGVPTAGQHA
ncbi:hypothetical protein [Deinococcus maricopensis]|uniref:Putative outer membrane phospholipase A n=1 Tax=Deinococcus maricopensis (strain DSM 21211 / LMG 22137 / NRRL B-23946 / LB-34) TaxID=709986 RepID=E8U3S8_DEIML|nr:hypothetical protein [Deinococcus maricopensis]ADV68771.1 putative outer membrane phospholipase A [Deinococcus maricopensis DSM 21211]